MTELTIYRDKRGEVVKTTIADFVARLKDQDSKIQRVSAEVEMNKRSPHVIATNP